MEEEFVKFKQLNPDLANDSITVKDLTFYWNLIRSNNIKVSKVYARQTKYIAKDETWNEGNFFMLLIILQYIEYRFAQPYGVVHVNTRTKFNARSTVAPTSQFY